MFLCPCKLLNFPFALPAWDLILDLGSAIYSKMPFLLLAVLLMTHLVRACSSLHSRLSMKSVAKLDWRELSRNSRQLDPKMTLIMGQCFNWNKLPLSAERTKDLDMWVAIVDGRPIAIKNHDKITSYAPLLEGAAEAKAMGEGLESYLNSYFQLEHNLEDLYKLWGQGCPRMKTVTAVLPGVRVVRQDPWECLISFICSSNNNIKRITLMLDRLKRTYGNYVCSVVRSSDDDDFKVIIDPNPPVIAVNPVPKDMDATADDEESAENVIHLFDFPTVETLADAAEADLRALGMGYRAKFIKGTAEKVLELGGVQWLESLRTDSRPSLDTSIQYKDGAEPEDGQDDKGTYGKNKTKKKKGSEAFTQIPHRLWVNEQLQMLPGVGRKVADCVAVFSLDQAESIPVDVHVWDIAVRDYAPDLQKALSLTPTIYEQVGDLFRDRFKSRAGWAHSVLFAAELPGFKQMLPEEMQEEMDLFDAEQRKMKQEKRDEAKKRKEEKGGTQLKAKAQKLDREEEKEC